jgi:tetratricopeptide (TPR) repeat protein
MMKLFAVLLVLAPCVLAAECLPSKLGPQEALARARELESKAQSDFQQRDFSRAAQGLREALCLAPKDARMHYELGLVEAAAGNLAQARRLFEQADRLQPDNMLPLAMTVRVDLQSGQTENLKQSLRALARRFPGQGKLHAQLARDLVDRRQLDLALAEALRFENSGENDPEALLALAVLENEAGAYDDAIRHALAIVRQGSYAAKLRASAAGIAGLSFESLGKEQEAIEQLILATQLDPSQETPYLSLAALYAKAQRFKDAVSVLEMARPHLPDSPDLLLALGSDLVSAGEYRDAVRILTVLIEKHPDQFEAYKQLAEAHRNLDQADQATQTLRKLGERKPDFPMLHVMTAQSLLAEAPVDHSKVLQELAEAEKANPADSEIYYLRGKVLAALNRYAEAVPALRRAIELQPADTSSYYQLGLAYQRLGQTDLAKQQFDRMEHLKRTSGAPQP